GRLLARLAIGDAQLPGTNGVVGKVRVKPGLEGPPPPVTGEVEGAPAKEERRVVPDSVRARMLANPFLPPDYSAATPTRTRAGMLAGWELLQPLLRSFETSSEGAPSCMTLPEPSDTHIAFGRELMPHQAQV